MIYVAILIALVTVPVAIVESGLRRAHKADLAESWSLVRLVFSALFALIIGQLLAPRGYLWWVNVLLAVVITALELALCQAAAKWLSHRKLGQSLMRSLDPLVKQVNLAFTPLTGPKIEDVEEYEQELLDSVEDFTETIAREIMVPRVDIESVESNDTLAQAMQVFLRTGYSRLPVTGKSIDDIIGVLYLKDVSRISFEAPAKLESKVAGFCRPVAFIPEVLGVDDLLKNMQASRTHIAIAVDEYGGVAGLVTLEDLIEEIVGEITDEYDRELPDVIPLEGKRYRVSGKYSTFDLGELYGIELTDDDVDSVGGLVVKNLGRLAIIGDTIDHSGLRIRVEQVEKKRKRIVYVTVEPTEALESAEASFTEEK